MPWSLRLANAAVSYAAYLGKLLLPRNLAVFYPIPAAIPAWQVAGAAALLAALTALAVLESPAGALARSSAGSGSWERWCR